MTSRDHFDAAAAGIASLAPNDPELLAAREHARVCARCFRALQEAQELMALLDTAPPPAPSPESLARVSRRVLATVRVERERGRAWPLAAVIVAWGIGLLLAKSRAHGVAGWVESAALLAVSLAIARVASSRGRLAVAAALGASMICAVVLGTVAGASGPLALQHGLKCTAIELVAGALPYGVWAIAVLRRREAAGLSAGAVMAAAGALAGQAALLLTCPERSSIPHMLVAHCGGVVLAIALASLGQPLLAKRLAR